jgi:transposase
LRNHYKKVSSGFKEWDQGSHAEEYTIFSSNIGKKLSIDEVSLSDGELYTLLTNKSGHGKNGTLVATINSTKSEDIINILQKIPLNERLKVKEITLDMAKNMEAAVKSCFPNATLVTDRFHVVRLVQNALQHLRVKLGWDALEQQNTEIKLAKEQKIKYVPKTFTNGDTPKQLLTRSRYILAKNPENWTENQQERAKILFENYPKLKEVHDHVIEFRNIYQVNEKENARQKLLDWMQKTPELQVTEFNSVMHTIEYNFDQILNFFENRSTNASAESFNAKLKLFRANLRGVRDKSFPVQINEIICLVPKKNR